MNAAAAVCMHNRNAMNAAFTFLHGRCRIALLRAWCENDPAFHVPPGDPAHRITLAPHTGSPEFNRPAGHHRRQPDTGRGRCRQERQN